MNRSGWCSQCVETVEVRVTVEWQPDFCATCGAEVDEVGPSSTPIDQ